jgi:DNA primase
MNMENLQTIKAIPIIEIARRLGIDVKNNKAYCIKGHDVKTPSLSFDISNNKFKCFGCGISGSNIDLVMESLNYSFIDAVKWLKESFSIYTDTQPATHGHSQPHTRTQPHGQPQAATGSHTDGRTDGRQYDNIYKYFLRLLDEKEAILYLQARHIDANIVNHHRIKAIPKNQVKLITDKLIKQFGSDKLVKAGLLWSNSKQLVFKKNRLVIPYLDRTGKTIFNLQGRDIDISNNPKTERTRYLFLQGIKTGLYNSKALSQSWTDNKTIYLCEGALDVLSCYSYNLKLWHPVGVPGVSGFRDCYIDLLKNFDVIIAADFDDAGETFYRDIKKKFLKAGKEIKRLDKASLLFDRNIKNDCRDINEILISCS